jgi:hypothetical protein
VASYALISEGGDQRLGRDNRRAGTKTGNGCVGVRSEGNSLLHDTKWKLPSAKCRGRGWGTCFKQINLFICIHALVLFLLLLLPHMFTSLLSYVWYFCSVLGPHAD